jgi:hypothetical protein
MHLQRDKTVAAVVQNNKDYINISHEVQALVVHKKTDNYVSVFPRSLYQDAWIKRKDLNHFGFVYLSWMEYFLKFPDKGYYARGNTALNIRKQADAKAEKVATLRGDTIQIRPTGKRKGLWLEVAVVEYGASPCEGGYENIVKQYRGWIKAVDDQGFPNIWYQTHGC